MLALTRKAEYALIAVCHLAKSPEALASARDIAEAYGTPLPLLMNILKDLQKAGFVRSVRGAHGGYLLAVEPQQVTLKALIEAIEGPVKLVRCAPPAGDQEPDCELAGNCHIRNTVQRIHEKLVQFLQDVTLAELVADERLTPLHLPDGPAAEDGRTTVAKRVMAP